MEAGILAAILAPTDAGLGQVIVASHRVPTKIRQALNVEAGLNDGLVVPFLLFFIAAFVAGLAVQVGFKEVGRHSVEIAEEWGRLLNLSVFFLFGLLVARAWGQIQPSPVLYALLSLTVVRIPPVALALHGTGLSRSTVLYMGWFGPRGLASIVLGLVYLEEMQDTGDATIFPRGCLDGEAFSRRVANRQTRSSIVTGRAQRPLVTLVSLRHECSDHPGAS
jgi:NhaP-type Na+/H+ or K+/H+ antiporter